MVSSGADFKVSKLTVLLNQVRKTAPSSMHVCSGKSKTGTRTQPATSSEETPQHSRHPA